MLFILNVSELYFSLVGNEIVILNQTWNGIAFGTGMVYLLNSLRL